MAERSLASGDEAEGRQDTVSDEGEVGARGGGIGWVVIP